MKLAGTSSPASGGEHLISHYFDMRAPAENRVEGWHGSQVGVATIITAALYERLKMVDPDSIDIEKLMSGRESADLLVQNMKKRHGIYADEAIKQYLTKYKYGDAYRAELKYITNNWHFIWSSLGELRSSEKIRNNLTKAGAPADIYALGLTISHLENAFLYANEIRDRFTVLDFAHQLDFLSLKVLSELK
jgi:glycerol-1-phosphate dehydrogenase [NAD(P)+]